MIIKKLLPLALIGFALLPQTYAQTCNVTPHFSPSESVSYTVVHELSQASQTIHISAYGITNQDIVKALINRHNNGVEVIVLSDKLQSEGKNSKLGFLSSAGIPVIIKHSAVLEHNKYIIIDGKEVLMGSWNFSNSADKQDNSAVVLTGCPEVVARFEADFQRIKSRDSRK